MQDSIMAGEGNSRYLKSVKDFLTRYPTYADFARALIEGTLPIDLNGINPEGWQVIGTALNKANLLQDDTAESLGLDSTAVPDDAFASLSSVASARIRVEAGDDILAGDIVDITGDKASKKGALAAGKVSTVFNRGENYNINGDVLLNTISENRVLCIVSGEIPISFVIGTLSGDAFLSFEIAKNDFYIESGKIEKQDVLFQLKDSVSIFLHYYIDGEERAPYTTAYWLEYNESNKFTLKSTKYVGRYLTGGIRLSNTKILVSSLDSAYDDDTKFYIVTFDEVGEGTVTDLQTIYGTIYRPVIALSSTKVLLATKDGKLAVATLSGSSISCGTEIPAFTGDYIGVKAVALSANKIFITYGGNARVITVSETEILISNEITVFENSTGNINPAPLNSTTIAAFCLTGNGLELATVSENGSISAPISVIGGTVDYASAASIGGFPVAAYSLPDRKVVEAVQTTTSSQATEGIAVNSANVGQPVTVCLDGNMPLNGINRGDEIISYNNELVGHCYADGMVNVIGKWKRK